MIPDEILALYLVVSGALATAALFFGLWFGERGRRKDVQRYAKLSAPGKVPKAEVVAPGEPVSQTSKSDLAAAKAAYVEETMRTYGCSREEAEQDWDQMVAQVYGDTPPPPDGPLG